MDFRPLTREEYDAWMKEEDERWQARQSAPLFIVGPKQAELLKAQFAAAVDRLIKHPHPLLKDSPEK